ncbi:unnamed protein product [Rotaria sp. Silwood1]|nr:unnamed protein product [Rotaria sp. Silwood1]CAF1571679.1 unnamed protein product [Rotaria sp. Silwood1]CAF3697583.1 unnamed protein product [Rotaria sp. Silwood1]CAF3727663.1 unnamed protein product [Rotaria sp. Silwood1]CAF4653667.1 unnamed protein product [Rotaria sp. Silwood1]
MGKLDGKVALITGGSEGIGLATAQRFITEGAEHVFITGRRQEVLDEAVKKIGSKNVTAVQGDVSNMTDLDRLYDIIQKEKGRLDIVFANAGNNPNAPLGAITEKHFDDLININVKSVLFTVQKALPILVDGGSIILTGSIGSMKATPTASVYCATKAAVRSFARCWTVDLKERKIRVNTLSPGPIKTPMLERAGKSEAENKAFITGMIARSPMSRLGTPDEIAKAAVFLASDDSSYITGIELCVDGGLAQI